MSRHLLPSHPLNDGHSPIAHADTFILRVQLLEWGPLLRLLDKVLQGMQMSLAGQSLAAI